VSLRPIVGAMAGFKMDTMALTAEPSGDARFDTADGIELYVEWKRPEDSVGAIVIVHGVGEHYGRYREFRDGLAAAGLACYGFDQRGHGRSAGNRGDVRRFADYVDDLALIVARVRDAESTLPLFLFGHSMGALVVLQYVIRTQDRLNGLVLTGSPVNADARISRPLLTLLKLIAWAAPQLSFHNRIRPEQLTHDVVVRDEYAHDPLNNDRVTARWIVELIRAAREVRSEARAIRIPLLALHGRDDQIADPSGTQELISRVGSPDKQVVLLSGDLHEVLNEPLERRARTRALITDWIGRHLG
jgi:alpha-beta hydrolase superfamily lysophospholipase